MALSWIAMALIQQSPCHVANPSPFNIKWIIPRLISSCPITKLAHSSGVCPSLYSAAVSLPYTCELYCSFLDLSYNSIVHYCNLKTWVRHRQFENRLPLSVCILKALYRKPSVNIKMSVHFWQETSFENSHILHDDVFICSFIQFLFLFGLFLPRN